MDLNSEIDEVIKKLEHQDKRKAMFSFEYALLTILRAQKHIIELLETKTN